MWPPLAAGYKLFLKNSCIDLNFINIPMSHSVLKGLSLYNIYPLDLILPLSPSIDYFTQKKCS